MSLNYVKHEKLLLRNHPEYNVDLIHTRFNSATDYESAALPSRKRKK